jgi:hypothetical protein
MQEQFSREFRATCLRNDASRHWDVLGGVWSCAQCSGASSQPTADVSGMCRINFSSTHFSEWELFSWQLSPFFDLHYSSLILADPALSVGTEPLLRCRLPSVRQKLLNIILLSVSPSLRIEVH